MTRPAVHLILMGLLTLHTKAWPGFNHCKHKAGQFNHGASDSLHTIFGSSIPSNGANSRKTNLSFFLQLRCETHITHKKNCQYLRITITFPLQTSTTSSYKCERRHSKTLIFEVSQTIRSWVPRGRIEGAGGMTTCLSVTSLFANLRAMLPFQIFHCFLPPYS